MMAICERHYAELGASLDRHGLRSFDNMTQETAEEIFGDTMYVPKAHERSEIVDNDKSVVCGMCRLEEEFCAQAVRDALDVAAEDIRATLIEKKIIPRVQ